MIKKNRVSITNEYEKGKTHVLLKHPLTIDEWNEILENQRIVKRLKEKYDYNLKERWCPCSQCEREQEVYDYILKGDKV